MPAVGAALALWSAATLAGLYSVSTSLTAASNGLPQGMLSPRTIALGDQRRQIANAWAPHLGANGGYRAASLTGSCDTGCFSLATSFRHDGQDPEKLKNKSVEGKMARLRLPSPDSVAHEKVVLVASAAGAADRFDGVVKRAALSPQKLADAFARAEKAPFLLASLPSASRFGGAQPDAAPIEARFGPQPAEIGGASDLALALANIAPEDTADVPTAVALQNGDAPDVAGPDAANNADNGQDGAYQVASLPPQDDLPDTIAVPGLRPRTTLERATEAPVQNAAKPQKPEAMKPQVAKAKPQPAEADTAQSAPTAASPRSGDQALPGVPNSKPIVADSKPGKRKAQASEMLAYAKPDTPERGGLGSAFRSLFDGPSTGNGVAVYDISARTVYMPDGSRLEAHSGLGSMVDQPRFVNRKNVGPTPPDTYNLSLRESRFHGVEAIRLTPASGSNKYGRNGLLAHTYMLRGGRAESNGCVVFKDYHRFLAAYKSGKIKRLVVVPRLTSSPTRVAQEGRQG
ncbi:tlde1 domain-containing protein [Mesorhizobium atlanticum]|uniref:tlde1 domain-containing protein n=1 Tax=Mesorhizobium atlanticum TaxID=2233532 RepID=UPI001FE08FAA|nr:tlde1 domain-containing protein [Mesorhizobium atlanticum]